MVTAAAASPRTISRTDLQQTGCGPSMAGPRLDRAPVRHLDQFVCTFDLAWLPDGHRKAGHRYCTGISLPINAGYMRVRAHSAERSALSTRYTFDDADVELRRDCFASPVLISGSAKIGVTPPKHNLTLELNRFARRKARPAVDRRIDMSDMELQL